MINKLMQGKALPVLIIVGGILAFWYVMAVQLNTPWQLGVYERAGVTEWTNSQFISDTLNQDRPVLPSVHQVATEIWNTTVLKSPTSRRSLIYHTWITLSATLLGFTLHFFG